MSINGRYYNFWNDLKSRVIFNKSLKKGTYDIRVTSNRLSSRDDVTKELNREYCRSHKECHLGQSIVKCISRCSHSILNIWEDLVTYDIFAYIF